MPAAEDSVITIGDVQYFVVNGKKSAATISIAWTADSGDGSVTATTIPLVTAGLQGWRLYAVETNPGTAPTASYDITLVDTQGIDMSGGKLTDLSATASAMANISTTTIIYPVVIEDWTFTLANNTENSATGVLILIFVPVP